MVLLSPFTATVCLSGSECHITTIWHHYGLHQVYQVYQIYGDIHLGWVGDLLEMKFMFGLSAEAIMGKMILFRSSNQAKAQRSLQSVVSG